jgi:hypothetical protein
MASHGQMTCEDLHKIEYCMCVLRGTNLTAKPQHAKERNSRGAPTRRTGIPGDDRTDARAAHRHVIDSFIGGRWSARSEDGVGTDVLLVGGWGADEIRPLRLSRQPFRDIWKSVASGDTDRYCCPILCRSRTVLLVSALLSEFFSQARPFVQFSEANNHGRTELGRQASGHGTNPRTGSPQRRAGKAATPRLPPRRGQDTHAATHPQLSVPASVAVRLRSMCVGPRPQRNEHLASRARPNRFFPRRRSPRLRLLLPPNSSAPSHR